MNHWKITPAGRVVLALLVASAVAAGVAPDPWQGVGAAVAGVIVLGWVMSSFVGGSVGGYVHRTPMPEDERLARFRRMYGPRRRD